MWLETAELCMEDYTKTGKQHFLDAAHLCIDMFEQLEQEIKTKNYTKRDNFLEKFTRINEISCKK